MRIAEHESVLFVVDNFMGKIDSRGVVIDEESLAVRVGQILHQSLLLIQQLDTIATLNNKYLKPKTD